MKSILKYNLFITIFLLIASINSYAQKIDTDSLLVALSADTKTQKDPQEIINKAHKAIKIAPDYLDYYVLMGRNFERIPLKDSAQFYYKKVITQSDNYPDTYHYLINLDISNKQYDDALKTITKAEALYPNESLYYDKKKLAIYSLTENENAELELLKQLTKENQNDLELQERYVLLNKKLKSDRIGIQYTNTTFNREGYGPWNQLMLQYIRSRKWGTLIGNINSMNRMSDVNPDINGIQFEATSYIFTTPKNYLYLNAAFSNNIVYPKYRLGANYYVSFRKSWEANFGVRYTETQTEDFTALVLGFGTYYKSFWFNLSSFVQSDDSVIHPALTFTSRYYFDTKDDYFFGILGYGTSPDDNNTAGLYEERLSLNSYRLGGGASKIFNKHYVVRLQFIYNNQEYVIDKRQNEYEISALLQYKF